jgi:hypothetical protein
MMDLVTLVNTLSNELAFTGGCSEASCLCSRCENKRMLSEYEMSVHLA